MSFKRMLSLSVVSGWAGLSKTVCGKITIRQTRGLACGIESNQSDSQLAPSASYLSDVVHYG